MVINYVYQEETTKTKHITQHYRIPPRTIIRKNIKNT